MSSGRHVVARETVRDGFRSRSVYASSLVFVLSFALVVYLRSISPSPASLAQFLLLPVYFLVPLAALIRGSGTVSGPRGSGSLKLHLGLPHTRGEYFSGVVAGRVVLDALAVVAGVVVAVAVYGIRVGVPGVSVLGFLGATALLVVTFGVVFVSVSAATSTSSRSMSVNLALFLAFLLAWGAFPALILRLLTALGSTPGSTPTWVAVFSQLNPLNAFRTVALTFASVGTNFARPGASVAFYDTGWFGVVVLLAWATGAFAVGRRRFEAAEF